jgi:hypothetical protein
MMKGKLILHLFGLPRILVPAGCVGSRDDLPRRMTSLKGGRGSLANGLRPLDTEDHKYESL